MNELMKSDTTIQHVPTSHVVTDAVYPVMTARGPPKIGGMSKLRLTNTVNGLPFSVPSMNMRYTMLCF